MSLIFSSSFFIALYEQFMPAMIFVLFCLAGIASKLTIA